jgi:hypothetical protein
MKNPAIFVLILFVLSSCVRIYFKDPQPKGGILLKEFPKELCGEWMEKGGLLVEKDGISFIEFEKDTLNNTVDTIYQKAYLSDSVSLYKAKDIYVLNTRKQGQHWEIFALSIQNNGDINVYQITEPQLFAKDKNLHLEEARFMIDERDTIVQTLRLKYEGTQKLKSATFSGQMGIKTVKKALKQKDQLLLILKKDGSFGEPGKGK